MPLFLKPHTVTRLARANQTASGAVVGTTRASAGTVQGHLQRLDASQAIQQFGVDSVRLGKWLQDVGAAAWVPGDHFTLGSQTWAIRSGGTVKNAESLTAHEVYEVEMVD